MTLKQEFDRMLQGKPYRITGGWQAEYLAVQEALAFQKNEAQNAVLPAFMQIMLVQHLLDRCGVGPVFCLGVPVAKFFTPIHAGDRLIITCLPRTPSKGGCFLWDCSIFLQSSQSLASCNTQSTAVATFCLMVGSPLP